MHFSAWFFSFTAFVLSDNVYHCGMPQFVHWVFFLFRVLGPSIFSFENFFSIPCWKRKEAGKLSWFYVSLEAMIIDTYSPRNVCPNSNRPLDLNRTEPLDLLKVTLSLAAPIPNLVKTQFGWNTLGWLCSQNVSLKFQHIDSRCKVYTTRSCWKRQSWNSMKYDSSVSNNHYLRI